MLGCYLHCSATSCRRKQRFGCPPPVFRRPTAAHFGPLVPRISTTHTHVAHLPVGDAAPLPSWLFEHLLYLANAMIGILVSAQW